MIKTIQSMSKFTTQLFIVAICLFSVSCATDSDPEPIPEIELKAPPIVKAATEVSGTSFVANWEQLEGAKYYIIQVSSNVEFTAPVTAYYDLRTNGTSIEVTSLNESSKYFYRVKAGNSLGETGFSKIMNARSINKQLLYNIIWKGDEVKSKITGWYLQDIKFSDPGYIYNGLFGGSVVSEGTWNWKESSNTISVVLSNNQTFDFTFIDVNETYINAYASVMTPNLLYYNK